MKYLAVVGLMGLVACGGAKERVKVETKEIPGPAGQSGSSCSVDDKGTIKCTDGSTFTIPKPKDGVDGKNGRDGAPGEDGLSGSAGAQGVQGIQGVPGEAIVGPQGPAGVGCSLDNMTITCGDSSVTLKNGSDGSTGSAGSTGESGYNSLIDMVSTSTCTNGGTTILSGLDINRNDLLDIDEVQKSSQICNGSAGAQGAAGTNGSDAQISEFTPVALVIPCNNTRQHAEVFLRLKNNMIIASFSQNQNGLNTRFSSIGPGSYVTSDSYSCYFKIDNQGNLYDEHY